METSIPFRNDCWLYLSEKSNQEYIKNQEAEIDSKKDQIFNDLIKK